MASELDETTGLKNCWTPIDERDDEETARNNHGSLTKENKKLKDLALTKANGRNQPQTTKNKKLSSKGAFFFSDSSNNNLP